MNPISWFSQEWRKWLWILSSLLICRELSIEIAERSIISQVYYKPERNKPSDFSWSASTTKTWRLNFQPAFFFLLLLDGYNIYTFFCSSKKMIWRLSSTRRPCQRFRWILRVWFFSMNNQKSCGTCSPHLPALDDNFARSFPWSFPSHDSNTEISEIVWSRIED
jgi:hypothetical protein